MGKVYKFFETELQHSGASAKSKFMYIDVLPEQEGELTYNGEEQFPAWKNLDPLKLLVEGEKSATNAGTHYITVTPMGNFAWPDNTQTAKEIPYIIKRKPLTAVPSQRGTLTYNQNQQTPAWNNYNSTELTIGGTYQNQSGAGTYTATFTPTSNYCWSDNTFAAKNITWIIGKLKLTKPSASTTSYSYTGSAVSLVVSNYNSTYMTQAGTTQATNIGNYSATYTLKSTTNTCWSDNSTGVVTISWKIAEVTVAKVTANTRSFTYNKADQEPTWNNYNSTYMTKSGDGANKNVGSYSTTFTLKDGVKWNDGSTDAITITWQIDRKVLAKPTMISTPYTYDGKTKYPLFNDTGNSDYYTISGTSIDAGSNLTCTLSLKDKNNCYWQQNSSTQSTADITYTYTVNKKALSVPTQDGTVEYDGFSIDPTVHVSWSGYDSTKMSCSGSKQTNVGTYNATFTITNSNYCFPNNATSATAQWKISKATLDIPLIWGNYTYETEYYSGISYKISDLLSNDYDSNKMTAGGSWSTALTKVGSVTATLTPKSNYQWSDGTTSAKTYKLTITKATSDMNSVSGSTMIDISVWPYGNCVDGTSALQTRHAPITLGLAVPNGWTPTLSATGGWNCGSAKTTSYKFANQPSDTTNYYWVVSSRGSGTSGTLTLKLINPNYNDWTYNYGTVYGD